MNRVQRFFLSLLALVAVAAPASAQTWTALGPAGGEFPRVFINPSQPTTLFAMPGHDVRRCRPFPAMARSVPGNVVRCRVLSIADLSSTALKSLAVAVHSFATPRPNERTL